MKSEKNSIDPSLELPLKKVGGTLEELLPEEELTASHDDSPLKKSGTSPKAPLAKMAQMKGTLPLNLKEGERAARLESMKGEFSAIPKSPFALLKYLLRKTAWGRRWEERGRAHLKATGGLMDETLGRFPLWQKIKRLLLWGVGIITLSLSTLWGGFALLNKISPLPPFTLELSPVVLDRNGEVLRHFSDEEGFFRHWVNYDEVNPQYFELLIAYEDRFFYKHNGVNPLATLRALGQMIWHRKIISGSSTLSMQVARLLYPHDRSLKGKVIEAFRALQLEKRYSKEELLTLYINLAPMGGNIEGLAAASWRYFSKAPSELNRAESAFLVALPQRPNAFRPDRHPENALYARNKVLTRAHKYEIIDEDELMLLSNSPLGYHPQATQFHAPLLSERLVKRYPDEAVIYSTIDKTLQVEIERLIKNRADRWPQKVSSAVMVLDNRTEEVHAYIGSADLFSESRAGFIDMTQAIRSPGSTLKPFAYGMALDAGIVHEASLLTDVRRNFNDYGPKNFDGNFSGAVTMAHALQQSLNVPVVQVLTHLTPHRFIKNLRNAGVTLYLEEPTLSLILGGIGITLEEQLRLFSALGRQGVLPTLKFHTHFAPQFKTGFEHGREGVLGTLMSEAEALVPLDQIETATEQFTDTHSLSDAINERVEGAIEGINQEVSEKIASAQNVIDSERAHLSEHLDALTGEKALLLEGETTQDQEYQLTLSEGEKRAAEAKTRAQSLREEREGRILSPEASWLIHRIMSDVRPPSHRFTQRKIAWKTGTSYGYRDGWAIGVTHDWTVAVWVGRPDGSPNLGVLANDMATPLLFDLFTLLPEEEVALPRPEGIEKREICWPSGRLSTHVAKEECARIFKIDVIHQLVPPTLYDGPKERNHGGWPILLQNMWHERGILPKEVKQPLAPQINGLSDESILFKLRDDSRVLPLRAFGSGTLRWYLDGVLLERAELPLNNLSVGIHRLTVVDERGESHSIQIEVRLI